MYDQWFPRIYNYVRARVGVRETADDVTGMIFERLLTKLDRYDSQRSPFDVWLFTIARNAVSDHYRAKKRRFMFSFPLLDDGVASDPDPVETMTGDEERALLLKSLSRLNEREREIVSLRFYAGLTNRAIAGMLDLSEGNVAIILFRAVGRLKKHLMSKESGNG